MRAIVVRVKGEPYLLASSLGGGTAMPTASGADFRKAGMPRDLRPMGMER